jgi:hypothetical protein
MGHIGFWSMSDDANALREGINIVVENRKTPADVTEMAGREVNINKNASSSKFMRR